MDEPQQEYYLVRWGDEYYAGVSPTGRVMWTKEITDARMLTQEEMEFCRSTLTGGPFAIYAVDIKFRDMM